MLSQVLPQKIRAKQDKESLTLLRVGSPPEGDALYALRRALSDPRGVLQSWDPTLVNPCTWFHVTCNRDGRVTRL
ncbi:hypothetical protein E2562_020571 [Oryza meyeriana var. granulata]|uniref:Leucine-rich repeat-containing N-terminal plant-type domain-containing protein n=1 Tax=Oryza meyeriana var. granulata TaxID=110450 RepID=A0A6G1DZA8_9ORYZ|nr:hypothetical protein E2562_020571 [Oryza meyeriana var. granulata]